VPTAVLRVYCVGEVAEHQQSSGISYPAGRLFCTCLSRLAYNLGPETKYLKKIIFSYFYDMIYFVRSGKV